MTSALALRDDLAGRTAIAAGPRLACLRRRLRQPAAAGLSAGAGADTVRNRRHRDRHAAGIGSAYAGGRPARLPLPLSQPVADGYRADGGDRTRLCRVRRILAAA